LITNIKNDKKYVGITKQNVERRFQQHCYKSSNCTILSRAIEKHGSESFELSILELCEDKNIAVKLEIKYIAELETQNNKNGYNLKSGGDYVDGHSDVTRIKMSKARLGKKRDPMSQEQKDKISKTRLERGIKHSAETIEKVRQARIGYKFPKEFGQRISERQKGSNNPAAKDIQASTGEVFGTTIEAAEWCNGNKGGIANNARGISKSSGKHPETGEKLTWKYL
jgi:group I intron endonuclease|tara:strand:+ start:493 stop:1167 length:675 start_codon:yes stop_codon:yes gene_type:complete